MTTIEQLTDRKTYPPITCQPWCAYGDGHPHEDTLDQTCVGIEQRVTLHLSEKTNDEREREGDSPNWQHDYLTVYPHKRFAHEPDVFLGKGEMHTAEMTPDEAHELGTALLEAVAQIRGQA